MSKTVFVASKLSIPFMLQIRNAEGAVVKEARLESAKLQPQDPRVPAPNALKQDGVGLTSVEEGFWLEWEKWAKANKFAPYVNGFIFAAAKQEDVIAEAREKAKEMTLMEGLDPEAKTDPRMSEFQNPLSALQKGTV